MFRTLILSGTFALVAPSLLSAQDVRWNDRYAGRSSTPGDNPWSDDAPRVRVFIDGPRAVYYGAPMRVRFEVSDNAFVTVVRVDDDGRMTILFPHSRTQRAAVRGGQVYYARNPRLPANFSFVATDRMGGYVFALASYSPLDFSRFENRDYDRIGNWSRFTQANRSIARRPDVFIDRFAASVLWDTDTPYDYDVDYYFPIGYPGTLNAYAMCGSSAFGPYYGLGDFGYFFGWRTYLSQLSSWDRMAYPFLGMCNDWYDRLQCYSSLGAYYGNTCNFGRTVVANQPQGVPGTPVDTGHVPNEGVILGGLFTPTPVPVNPEPESTLPTERPPGRFDQPWAGDLDNVMSIPTRATRKMKEEDARREREAAGGTSPARTGFDRTDAATGKPEKARANDGAREAATRLEPPPREPTKAKATGEPRRETVSRGDFGSTGRTSNPRPSGGDRVSRPADTKTTGSAGTTSSPASIQGATTTEKKKPPKH